MFERLVKTAHVAERYRKAPLAQERERYLEHLHRSGHSHDRLKRVNHLLLAVVERTKINGKTPILVADLFEAAGKWVAQTARSSTLPRSIHGAQIDFVSSASGWLRFLGWLEEPCPTPEKPFSNELAMFLHHLHEERGLTDMTLVVRGSLLERFFAWLSGRGGSLLTVTPATITDFFLEHRQRGWKRRTIICYGQSLRAFFRYAASRGWCADNIAKTIDRPCMYSYESLPQGLTWIVVQSLIANVSGNRPANIRDRAAILLLAVYGLRIGEVCALTLDDIDWDNERIHCRRPKQRRTNTYPLTREIGEAVIRYLQEVRPRSSHRQLFLRTNTPHHPISSISLGSQVRAHIRRLGIQLPHYGPHVLRHSCATHLLSEGFSLKEIGDHLGHRSAETTQIYAKVDHQSLREVAAFGLTNVTDLLDDHKVKSKSHQSRFRLDDLRKVANLNLGGVL
jgi:site-specific recombinase XerD